MKKNMNKLATLALTGILAAGMSFGAMAESTEKGVFDSNSGTITLQKKINIGDLSGDVASADVPTASYTYTISNGTAGTATGKDSNNNNVTLQVEAGPMNAVSNNDSGTADSTKTVSFGPSDKDVKTETGESATYATGNYAVTKNLSFSFVASEFKHAGIFRYVITETAATTNPTTITHDDNYSTERVLDVWVKNTDAGLEISNFTLYKKNTTGAYDANTKSWGWTDNETSYTGDSTDNTDAENFKTTDLKVEKKIAGSLANKSQTFDFTVELEPTATDDKTNTYTGMEVTVVKPDGTKGVVTVTDNKISVTGVALSDSKNVVIYGIPSDVKYTISEVDATKNNYVATAKVTTFTGSNIDSQTASNLTAGAAEADGKVTSTLTADDSLGADGKYVQVTNTLNDTTPTGVVMNIAPYAAMILGAGAFAGIFLCRKKTEDEE